MIYFTLLQVFYQMMMALAWFRPFASENTVKGFSIVHPAFLTCLIHIVEVDVVHLGFVYHILDLKW